MKLSRIKSALLITPLIVVAGLSIPAIAAAQSAVQIDQTCNADREGKCAKATPVTFEDPTCGQLGSYTRPSSEGVDYTIAQKIVQPARSRAHDVRRQLPDRAQMRRSLQGQLPKSERA